MDTTAPKMTNISIDPNNLYREETFTDLTYVTTIRRLTPVKADGSVDESREALFTGMTQLMSPTAPYRFNVSSKGPKP